MRANKFSLLLLLMLLVGAFTLTGHGFDDTKTADQSSSVIPQQDGDNSTANLEDEKVDSDDDGVDDEKEEAYARDIEIESEAYKFKSKSVLRDGESKDEFRVEFDADSNNPAELRFDYSTEASVNSTATTETELSYEVKFDEIIEYVDSGALGYQNETPVSTYEIGITRWTELNVLYNETIGFVEINATTLDGVFTLIMKLSSSFLVDDNVTISPNSLKIDVIINNFAYQASDTKLAIKTHVKTESELSVETESEDEIEGIADNETQIGIKANNATGFFSWVEHASMDGQVVDVLSSSMADSSDEEGETSSKIYFSFNSTAQADQIVWDPKVGISSGAAKANLDSPLDDSDEQSDAGNQLAGANDEDSSLPISFLWGFIFLLGIPILRRLRR